MSIWLRLLKLMAVLLRYQMWATMAKLAWDKLRKKQEYKVRWDG